MNNSPQNLGASSEATKIEQARAIAEVQAAIVAAKSSPRDTARAQAQMLATCQHRALAEKSFFKFPRGGGTITGPSIHLARELARCWGNIDYGVSELSRDDAVGMSEMLTWAMDLETNTRVSAKFIQPHSKDVTGGRKKLTELRDIYENNANAGARRLRECIYAVIPYGFTSDAEDACARTLAGGEKPLPERISDLLVRFGAIGIAQDRVEKKVGKPMTQWLPHDVALLGVAFRSITKGEVTLADEFPQAAITAVAGDPFVTASLGKRAEADIAATGGTPLNGNEVGVGGRSGADEPVSIAQVLPNHEGEGLVVEKIHPEDEFPGDRQSSTVPESLEPVFNGLQAAAAKGLDALVSYFFTIDLSIYEETEVRQIQDKTETLKKGLRHG